MGSILALVNFACLLVISVKAGQPETGKVEYFS